ncbi:MAG TPA: pantoate--beta-alanine ligase [Propionibacteriaceae bacterium]|nr:pantoate--beta-alanine ligase [Propionibacteriaceae bacterium]
MKTAHSLAEYAALRSALDGPAAPSVAYVPTMGALHDGHRSLIKLAKARGGLVVVSIFVNPLQFGPGEDYARYPRPLEDDLQVCEADGVDIVLVPSVTELYPAGRQVTVDAGALGSVLEGHSRPGHFNGVLTVVLKLFNIIRPQVAVFGEKDAQQLACIQRMVIDLNLAVEIVGAPIVREPDGLALSSRNVFLSASERAVARSLSAALEKAATQGSVRSARAAAYEVLDRAEAEPSFELDYATIVNPSTFAEVPDDHVGLATFVVAARVGGTRLIDNTTINFAPAPWG